MVVTIVEELVLTILALAVVVVSVMLIIFAIPILLIEFLSKVSKLRI